MSLYDFDIEITTDDKTNAPGPKNIVAGNSEYGYYGTITEEELVTFEEIGDYIRNGNGSIPTEEESPREWHKVSYKGEVAFKALGQLVKQLAYNDSRMRYQNARKYIVSGIEYKLLNLPMREYTDLTSHLHPYAIDQSWRDVSNVDFPVEYWGTNAQLGYTDSAAGVHSGEIFKNDYRYDITHIVGLFGDPSSWYSNDTSIGYSANGSRYGSSPILIVNQTITESEKTNLGIQLRHVIALEDFELQLDEIRDFISSYLEKIERSSTLSEATHYYIEARGVLLEWPTDEEYIEAQLEALRVPARDEILNFVDPEDYTINAQHLQNAIDAAIDAINAATSQEEIEEALLAGKRAINRIKTDRQEMAGSSDLSPLLKSDVIYSPDAKVILLDHDGNQVEFSGDDILSSIEVEQSALSPAGTPVGGLATGEIKVKLESFDENIHELLDIDNIDLMSFELVFGEELFISDIYSINKRDVSENNLEITITGYDEVFDLNVDYKEPFKKEDYPMTAQNWLDGFAAAHNIIIDAEGLPFLEDEIPQPNVDNISSKQILGKFLEWNFAIGYYKDNKIVCRVLKNSIDSETDEAVDRNSIKEYKSFKNNLGTLGINTLTLALSEDVTSENFSVNDQSMIDIEGKNIELRLSNNPFFSTPSQRAEYAPRLFEIAKGFNYHAHEFESNLIYLEPTNILRQIELDSLRPGMYNIPIYTYHMMFDGGFTVKTGAPAMESAETAAKWSQLSPSKRTEIKVDKLEGQIELEVYERTQAIKKVETAIEEIEIIEGPPGQDGKDGVDGKDGLPGAPGKDGVDGAPGAPGKDGVDGQPGRDGKDGKDGLPGRDGVDGKSTYIWIAYADSANGVGISLSPANKDYVGYAFNRPVAAVDISDPSVYAWQLVKGRDGTDGVDGTDGRDGKDGEDGAQGIPGEPGKDGKPNYTWIKYADDLVGNGMSDDPTGKKYIGFAYNKDTPEESNNHLDYEWQLAPDYVDNKIIEIETKTTENRAAIELNKENVTILSNQQVDTSTRVEDLEGNLLDTRQQVNINTGSIDVAHSAIQLEVQQRIDKDGEVDNKITNLTQDFEKFEFSISNTNGANLIQNSLLVNDLEWWEEKVEGLKTDINTWSLSKTSKNSITGNGKIEQTITVENNSEYSISFDYLKQSGAGTIFVYYITDGNRVNLIEETSTSFDERGNDFSMVFDNIPSGEITIGVEMTGISNTQPSYIANLIFTKGRIYEWSPYIGEVYTSGVTIDENGIKVKSTDNLSYTTMTPHEFAHYFRDDKVFTINKKEAEIYDLLVKGKTFELQGGIKFINDDDKVILVNMRGGI